MIFPGGYQKGSIKPDFNLAWTIVGLNLLIFLFANFHFSDWPQKNSYKDIQSKDFSRSITQMYIQTLDPVEMRDVADLSEDQIAITAIKDKRFWSRAESFPFHGDQVQIEKVKKTIAKLKDGFTDSIQNQYGLSASSLTPWAWITYQFTHHSFIHLIGNLIFLLMVIVYLESRIPATWIAMIYILGGIGGGIGFLLMNTDGDMAMIGASGSVCALLSFLMVYKKNETMPWTYFFAPIPKGHGEIYLPAFFIFPFYLMSDFTAILWAPSGVTSSVAHSAHIGGAAVGVVMGLLFQFEVFVRSKTASHSVLSDNDRLNKLL